MPSQSLKGMLSTINRRDLLTFSIFIKVIFPQSWSGFHISDVGYWSFYRNGAGLDQAILEYESFRSDASWK
jgi:hypothetical protein